MFSRIVLSVVLGCAIFYSALSLVVAAYHGFIGPAYWSYFMLSSIVLSGFLIEYGNPNKKVANKRLRIAIYANLAFASLLAVAFTAVTLYF